MLSIRIFIPVPKQRTGLCSLAGGLDCCCTSPLLEPVLTVAERIIEVLLLPHPAVLEVFDNDCIFRAKKGLCLNDSTRWLITEETVTNK